MSYLDALGQRVGSAKGVPSEFKETDIGAIDTDRQKQLKDFYKKLSPTQRTMLKDKLNSLKQPSKDVIAQNKRVDEQLKLRSNQATRERLVKETKEQKAFELKERDQAKKDANVAKDELAVLKAQKKESIKKQATRDKIEINAEKYIRDRDLFDNEIATFRAEQAKSILGPNDTEGQKIVEDAIKRKQEEFKIKQKYEMEQMMNRLWNKYGNMEEIREYLREFGLENELPNLVNELKK